MANKIKLNFGDEVLTLPRAISGEILRDAPALALKALIITASDASFRGDYDGNLGRICEMLACTRDELEGALAFLCEAGLLSCEGFAPSAVTAESSPASPERAKSAPALAAAAAEKLPSYLGGELDKIVNGNPEVIEVLNECQRMLEYMFKTAELNDIIAMFDYLGLDGKYILLSVEFAKECGVRRMSGVKTCILRWVREGITTYDELARHVERARARRSYEGKLRSMFGMGERKFSSKEEQIIAAWADANIPLELVRRAYDITIDNLGAPKMPYTAKIISNWCQRGIRSEAELDSAPKEPKENTKTSFDTDEFFELALKRSYEKLNSNGGGSAPQN